MTRSDDAAISARPLLKSVAMHHTDILDRIREGAGFPDGPDATVAAEHALAALGLVIDPELASEIAAALPEPWGRAISRTRAWKKTRPQSLLQALHEDLSLTFGVGPRQAQRISRVALRELGAALPPELLRRLLLEVPTDVELTLGPEQCRAREKPRATRELVSASAMG